MHKISLKRLTLWYWRTRYVHSYEQRQSCSALTWTLA